MFNLEKSKRKKIFLEFSGNIIGDCLKIFQRIRFLSVFPFFCEFRKF